MPILVTFDLSKPESRELNRIRGVFERLGWQRVGNTAYRYPRLGQQPATEDWLNRVIPALMMLRTLALFTREDNRPLVRFTIDAQSSTGFTAEGKIGVPPLPAEEIEYI